MHYGMCVSMGGGGGGGAWPPRAPPPPRSAPVQISESFGLVNVYIFYILFNAPQNINEYHYTWGSDL